MTVVIITHNRALMPMADKVIELRGGKVASVTKQDRPVPVADINW